MIADKLNKDLALDAYKIGENNSITKDKLVGNDKFKVLAVENNKDNGMQAMAVAPVDSNGEIDTSKIVISYAGTDFKKSNSERKPGCNCRKVCGKNKK